MSDSLGDVLAKRDSSEPPEFGIIKHFINEHFKAGCHISFQGNQIIIGVNSAALAGSLHMKLHELQDLCGPDRRLVIRILA